MGYFNPINSIPISCKLYHVILRDIINGNMVLINNLNIYIQYYSEYLYFYLNKKV